MSVCHVEVLLLPKSIADFDTVRVRVEALMNNNVQMPIMTLKGFSEDPVYSVKFDSDAFLSSHVQCIDCIFSTGLLQDHKKSLPSSLITCHVYVYQLKTALGEEMIADDGDEPNNNNNSNNNSNGNGSSNLGSHVVQLPSQSFHGLWESLIYDSDVKPHLLEYATTALTFSDAGVDPTIITWNRVVLLHGPPGTGKTSLCKGVAQKLSIRLSARYRQSQLVEVNAHSLFSKWFSESGKQVMKLFRQIADVADDKDVFVFILIDEVESLTAARSASAAEPSDAIRVVNAILTQLDRLRSYKNVMVLTTSNITGAIDLAFVDRADIKQYIGPPSVCAIYNILSSCIYELIRVGIVKVAAGEQTANGGKFHPFRQILMQEGQVPNSQTACSLGLLEISKLAVGMSGRTLRKLPFLAHANSVRSRQTTLTQFLVALHQAVQRETVDRREVAAYHISNKQPNGDSMHN